MLPVLPAWGRNKHELSVNTTTECFIPLLQEEHGGGVASEQIGAPGGEEGLE